jgi:hypothetical protein
MWMRRHYAGSGKVEAIRELTTIEKATIFSQDERRWMTDRGGSRYPTYLDQ